MSSSLDTHSTATGTRLKVPESLQRQLRAFRARVWTSKLCEALALATVGLLLAFLTVYISDRFFDTPSGARWLIFTAALALWLAIPWALHRWVWRNRRLDQLARLLRQREPSVGDQLLSVIELAANETEQARSRTLCAAAIRQVAETAEGRDFRPAAPVTRLRGLGLALLLAGVATVVLSIAFPAATRNAWARLSAPWRDTPRYTFTTIEPLAQHRIVPHGEATQLDVRLTADTQWQPEVAQVRIDNLSPIRADLSGETYRFELPPLTSPAALKLTVGDYAQLIRVEPKLRPELVSAIASVQLPEYLQRPEPYEQDVRSGVLNAVQGSQATLVASASRNLNQAWVDGSLVAVDGNAFRTTTSMELEGKSKIVFAWRDFDNLDGSAPFELTLNPLADEFPSVASQDLPRQAVVLDSEQINFQALAADDFGIKRIGIAWRGIDERLITESAEGEKVLAAGGPSNTSMQVPATFSAIALGISPQPIEVRIWVEDYLPGRERTYSPPHVLFVLTAEEHAIWITSQLSKWHRAALDVRDKELQLHEANKRLRALPPEELAGDEMQQELHKQASLEEANARRLTSLSRTGEDLLRQASRNPEIGVGHLDRWAEMLQILHDIGSDRMPSVAELLEEASKENSVADGGPKKPISPSAGVIRDTSAGKAPSEDEEEKEKENTAPIIPTIVDRESSQQPSEESSDEEQAATKKKGNGSRLSLPTTTLVGPAPKSDPNEEQQEADEGDEDSLDQALFEQEDLLAEFEKIADELNTILANMEGSTLVKRLKAASREQNQVADKISSRIDAVFGRASPIAQDDQQVLKALSTVEHESSQKISFIMDDMQSYFERRRMNQFKLVLDEMKQSDVLVALGDLAEALPKQQGMSIAQAEFWSDTLDRWAEDLVDPACSGQCPGCKTSDALPPSLILEVLKILESEVNLREETRVTEQARPAVEQAAHAQEAARLSSTQGELRARTDEVVAAILGLPEGAGRFPIEINLLNSVSSVMKDAGDLLAAGETGSPAIAAETEAIELLLQSKRINPKGGGGGGASPGGGGTGDTQDSALALLGSGLNQNERRERRDVSQATGETGRVLPEEFRAGLDEYFRRIESNLQ